MHRIFICLQRADCSYHRAKAYAERQVVSMNASISTKVGGYFTLRGHLQDFWSGAVWGVTG